MSTKQLKDMPLAQKRRANAQKTPAIENLIRTTQLTTHEIAKQLEVTDRRVSALAEKLGVDMRNRTKQSYAGRGAKISQSLRQNGGAERANAQRRHTNARLTPDYLGRIPEWAWRVIEAQPEMLLIDKLIGLSQRPTSTVELFVEAERALGRKVSAVEMNEYLPHIEGVDWFNKQVSLHQPNSSAIAMVSGSQSRYESRVDVLLTEMGVTYQTRTRQFGFELDFYLPEQQLAIEVSPLSTHNSNQYVNYGMKTAEPKPQNYHKHKWQVAKDNGIKLITLFEKQLDTDNWQSKTVPMLRRLITGKAVRTIYARNVTVKPLDDDRATADAFLTSYHMDGKTPAKKRYGLYTKANDELIAVATFKTPTIDVYKRQNLLELKRLAFKPDVQVRFGISKLMKHVLDDNPDYAGIVTFSNNNMGWGDGYAKAGFDLIRTTGAQLTFVNPRNVNDTYSWSIATTWGAKSGVLAKAFGSQDITAQHARELVETDLPHRYDDGAGYVAQYDSGNQVWIKYRA